MLLRNVDLMELTKGKGIILRAIKYSEADLIITLLNSDGNKVSAIAKGAVKSKKRFAGGVLQPTHYIDFCLKKTSKELQILEEAHLINGFEQLRTDYDRMETAFYLLDIINRISQEGDVFGVGLFNLLGNGLKTLGSHINLIHFRLHFGLKVLHQQGVLEPESWMTSYLATPLDKSSDLVQIKNGEFNSKEIQNRIVWLENRLKEYVATGMI